MIPVPMIRIGGMMLFGTIYEYSEWPDLDKVADDVPFLLMAEGERIRDVQSGTIVYEDTGLANFNYGLGGIWVKREEGTKYVEHFIDIFNRGLQFDTERIEIGKRYWQETVCIYFEKKENNDNDLFLKIHDYQSKTIYERLTSITSQATNKQYIVGQNYSSDVVCYNMQAEIVWERKCKEKRNRAGRRTSKPCLFENIAIINLGIERNSKNNGTITAFDVETGQEVWTRIFPSCANTTVVGDKVYVAHKLVTSNNEAPAYPVGGTVLDAATGLTLLEIETGLGNTILFDDAFGTSGNYLYYLSYQNSGGSLRLFDLESGEMLQHLDMPEPYNQTPGYYPVFWDGTMYIALGIADPGLRGSSYALLALKEASGNEEPVITIEPRPEYYVLATPDNKGEAYHVIINDTDLEKVVRFGEIIIKNYAYCRGSHIADGNGERHNKLFNGQFYFSAPISVGMEDELKRMAKRIEEWSDENVYGLVDPYDISVNVVPMPDLTEELLKSTAPPIEYIFFV